MLVDRKIEDVPLGQARARGPPTCTAIGALEHAASACRIHDLRVPGIDRERGEAPGIGAMANTTVHATLS